MKNFISLFLLAKIMKGRSLAATKAGRARRRLPQSRHLHFHF
jgi:hypothetical protein